MIALGLVWLCLQGAPFDTQQQAPQPVRNPDLTIGPPFDVVSVKANTSGGSKAEGLGFPPGGRFSATNVTLREMIGAVYGPEFLGEGRIVGGPDWISTERFDVEAKVEGDPLPAQRRLMVRRLLADHFKLKLRSEERETQVLALRTAHNVGRLAPGFKESRADCPKMGVPPPPPPAGGVGAMPRPCGVERQPGKLIGYGTAPSQFARILAGILKRPVIDATELKGRYDFELQYAGDEASIFTALQEQLGLKLSDERRQISVLVIDNADRPKQ